MQIKSLATLALAAFAFGAQAQQEGQVAVDSVTPQALVNALSAAAKAKIDGCEIKATETDEGLKVEVTDIAMNVSVDVKAPGKIIYTQLKNGKMAQQMIFTNSTTGDVNASEAVLVTYLDKQILRVTVTKVDLAKSERIASQTIDCTDFWSANLL